MPEQTRRRGLTPGHPNPGGFKPGFDPRRVGGSRLFDGKTLAQLAREATPECVALLKGCITDEEQKMSDRLRAAELMLDRGWGKAVSVIDMTVTQSRNVRSLSNEELEAIARGESPRLPITVDGEAAEVLTAEITVDSQREDLSQ